MFDRKLTQKSAITPTVGVRGESALENNVRTFYVHMRVTAQLDVTVAGTLRNRGSVLALISKLGLNIDGEDRIIADARSMRAYIESASRRQLPATRATGAGIQAATLLSEDVIIPCSLPGLAFPSETSMLERNPQVAMRAFIDLHAAAATAGPIIGAGTGTATNIRATIVQVHDPKRGDLPLMRTSTREVVQSVAAANTELEVSIKGLKYIAAIIVQQDTDAGEVSDIINTVQLLGDDNRAIIPQPMTFAQLAGLSSLVDDNALATPASYVVLNFVDEGLLSKVIHPAAFTNLRFRFNALPSVVAGATNSKIRITLVELEQDAQLTAPALPFVV